METVRIHGRTFRVAYHEGEILRAVKAVADRINRDMEGKNPLFLAVLNGAFVFAADLLRMVTVPCEVSFVKLASYQGTLSTGKVKEVIGINEDLSGRHVVIVEDIVESGHTMKRMIATLGTRNPASISVCTLLHKPARLEERDLRLDYVAMEIPNDFIVGYGLDYDGQGRNLRDIYSIESE